MAVSSVSDNYSLPSIQTVYNLYAGGEHKLLCNNVIKIPIAESVVREIGTDIYNVIPYTALVIEETGIEEALGSVKIVIETNEGITVEPIVVHAPLVQYSIAYLLTLPRGTTGIKKAYIRVPDGYGFVIQSNLVLDIMEAPYNYENCLSALNHNEFVTFRHAASGHINELETGVHDLGAAVTNLNARVTALENKAGN